MNKWFYINIFIILYALWIGVFFFNGIPQLLGLLGLFIIIYNWTRHAIFSMIRSDLPRVRKMKYARFSKKMLPFHKWTGSLALLIILTHGLLIIFRYGWWWESPKFIMGIIALSVLILQVISGWMRWYRTTVKRRYFHWINAFVLIFLIIFHIIL